MTAQNNTKQQIKTAQNNSKQKIKTEYSITDVRQLWQRIIKFDTRIKTEATLKDSDLSDQVMTEDHLN